MTGTQLRLLACALAVGLLLSCSNSNSPSKKTIPSNQASGLALLASPTEPGVEFTKTTVGLPSRTLDFVGSPPLGLSGAKAANEIFLAADENGIAAIYSRNLETFERKQITTVKNLAEGSLTSSDNGNFLVYCKKRFIDRYIDDPAMQYPPQIALPYLFNIETGEETELFNFKDKDWLPYRTSATNVSISPDGKRVCFVSYNIDRVMLDNQLQQWLQYAEAYLTRSDDYTDQDLVQLEIDLRNFLGDTRIAPLVKEQGIDPFSDSPISADEQAAVRKLQQLLNIPEPVLLVFENGTQSMLPITVQEGYANHLHSIIGIGNDRVILGVQQSGADPTRPQEIFELDLLSGETSLVGTYQGVLSTMGMDPSQEFFMVVLNPMDEETKLILPQTNLVKFPLDGGDPITIELPGDFYGNIGMSSNGKYMVGQELNTNDLFLVNPADSTKVMLSQLVGPLDAVFINDLGNVAGYLDSGIIGVINVVETPAETEGWIDQSSFQKYETLVRDFISSAGYVFPSEGIFEWEQREGFGAHEVACSFSSTAETGAEFLARYSLKQDSFISIWYPTGNRLDRSTPFKGTDLDFYDCQKIAEEMLADVGWMDPATWQYYQPGSNPLYDGRSDSFVIIYRDGYFLNNGGQWVTNIEATLRVSAATGAVEEMSLSTLDEIQSQTLDISPDRAAFMIRNQENYALPPDMLVEFDTENFRLVIASKNETAWGPALYNSGLIPRLCYEIDGYIQPENELVVTAIVDVSTGEVLGQIDFMPTSVEDSQARLAGT